MTVARLSSVHIFDMIYIYLWLTCATPGSPQVAWLWDRVLLLGDQVTHRRPRPHPALFSDLGC